jgi:ADP-heptose:LPS heptosyltransferase
MQRLVVEQFRAPGDTLVLAAFLRDLALAHPGQFEVIANVHAPALLQHNPHIADVGNWGQRKRWRSGDMIYRADYGRGLRDQNSETIHYLAYHHRRFVRTTGIAVPVTIPTPDYHFTPDEEAPLIRGRYWVLLSGGKLDVTIKVWATAAFQRVVAGIRDLGLGVVQVGSLARGHVHPTLQGTLDLVGRTDLRELMRILRDADGIICGVTFAMHAAAALNRPCVVIAGGREAWWWEAYVAENRGFGPDASRVPVPHRYLHTIGLLPCCMTHGCWRNKVVPPDPRGRVCYRPANVSGQRLAECMAMIKPSHVLEAVVGYYEDRSLPPIEVRPDEPIEYVQESNSRFDSHQAIRRWREQGLTVPHPPPVPPSDTTALLDPIVGGKFTVFSLLYGDFHTMHVEHIHRLLRTLPRDRFDWRIGSNALCGPTARLISDLQQQGLVRVHYAHKENQRKYPVMREMFHDPVLPIETNYLIWLDDDTICDRNDCWPGALAQVIVENHPKGARLFGPKQLHPLGPGQPHWIEEAPWYSGRDFVGRGGRLTPGGHCIPFVSGSFWALHVPTMRELDVPDSRLSHNGGDYMIGAMVHQGGHGIVDFSGRKEHVCWSKYRRRGLSEPHPGAT